MREIKLGKVRVWDKINKKWYIPILEVYKGKLDDLFVCLSGALGRRTMKGMIHESTFPDQYEVNYYTGLKDKNGKEIYEGDIVQFGDGYLKEIGTGYWKVSYEAGNGFWYFERFDVPPEFWNMKTFSDLNICKAQDEIEIIGNIYENPKLLEKEK